MSTPTLTTTQKTALHNLMKQYFTEPSDTFIYVGAARRESYATEGKASTSTPLEGCMDVNTNKYFLNCGLFAQMIWMGRNISDFTSHASPDNTITTAFNWGYYFDFLSAKMLMVRPNPMEINILVTLILTHLVLNSSLPLTMLQPWLKNCTTRVSKSHMVMLM